MARGKYAAKAANRLAELDAGLVAELKKQLAAVTAERDSARSEVERLIVTLNSRVRTLARDLSGEEKQRLQDALLAEQKERTEDRRNLGRKLFYIWRRYDDEFTMPFPAIEEVVALFDLSKEVGNLITEGENNLSREARRTTAKKIHLLRTLEERGIRL